jgi:uridine kinase
MNPGDLVTNHLIEHCKTLNTIVICGYTKTGKVTIAKKLANALNRPLFVSDDFINIEDPKFQ